MKTYRLMIIFCLSAAFLFDSFALSSPAFAQKTEYPVYTGMPEEKVERLVAQALKKKYDWFYEEFSYVPYMQYAFTDLNGDGKPEIIARFTEEYAFTDEYENVDTHIFAYTKKGLIQIFEDQAIDIAIGKKDKSGLREIIAFKGLSRTKYDIYKWDGKRRYVKK